MTLPHGRLYDEFSRNRFWYGVTVLHEPAGDAFTPSVLLTLLTNCCGLSTMKQRTVLEFTTPPATETDPCWMELPRLQPPPSVPPRTSRELKPTSTPLKCSFSDDCE